MAGNCYITGVLRGLETVYKFISSTERGLGSMISKPLSGLGSKAWDLHFFYHHILMMWHFFLDVVFFPCTCSTILIGAPQMKSFLERTLHSMPVLEFRTSAFENSSCVLFSNCSFSTTPKGKCMLGIIHHLRTESAGLETLTRKMHQST